MLKRLLLTATLLSILAGPAAADDVKDLTGFRPVDISTWEPRTSQSLMALVEPVYRNHPESLEGRPSLSIELREDGRGGIYVDIRLGGLLDDSVAAELYRALISQTAGGWQLDAVGVRFLCARGENTDTMTAKLCP